MNRMDRIMAVVGVWALMTASLLPAAPPGNEMRAKVQRYEQLLSAARAVRADTREAERLNQLSFRAARTGQPDEAARLLDQAIAALAARAPTAADPARPPVVPKNGGAPVFFLPFTHHYAGPGGYYAKPEEVRAIGALLVKYRVPGTLFFDGILVERLQKEDPGLLRQLREWNLPIGYHGEETHGPYPVASELLGEVYVLKEAQGYRGPWSLTTGKDWGTAVNLVVERYSHSRPWKINEETRMLIRVEPSATDLSREGGLALVQKALGKDVSMMPSHALESAPEGYAFRRMSRFGFDQPAVPLALHALKIFRIGEAAEQVMRVAGENESLFWYMGRITSKGDDDAESGFRLGGVRATLAGLDRSRPRLLLMGISRVDEEEFARTVRYLEREFFPANPGSGWVSGETLPSFFEPEKAWRPSMPEIRELAGALLKAWSGRPPDMVAVKGRSLSLCDAFEALARACAGASSVELHPLYGPVAEEERSSLKAPLQVSQAGLRAAAQRVVSDWDSARGDRFVPSVVTLPEGKVNAAEFLFAMALAGSGPETTLKPALEVISSRLFPPYADTLQAVFNPRSNQPLCYTKGQLWTVKPVRLPQTGAAVAAAPAVTGAVSRVASGRLQLVFAANLDGAEPCFRDEHAGADLYGAEFDLKTGKAANLKRLTRRPGKAEWFPALSPDGKTVVYDCDETEPNGRPRRSLHGIDLATGADTELLPDARFPAFSAEGSRLFFSRQVRGGHCLLTAPVADGLRLGAGTAIADSRALGAELAEDPAPFPDGRAVAFHWKKEGSGAGVAIIGTDGTGLQALTPFDGCGHAAVSPDGNAVACSRSRDGRVLLIRRGQGTAWQPPEELPLSVSAADYQGMDPRFSRVAEVRHCYLEWAAPDLLLMTSHGADGPKAFRFARLFLVRLGGPGRSPVLIDLSAALEALAGKTGRDFCSASGRWIPE